MEQKECIKGENKLDCIYLMYFSNAKHAHLLCLIINVCKWESVINGRNRKKWSELEQSSTKADS